MKIIELYKKIKKHPKGPALLFFSFYLIFFIVLGIGYRAIPKDVVIEDSKDLSVISVENYNGVNYSYNVNINKDGVINNIYGEVAGYKNKFNNNNINYYYEYNYYKEVNGKYELLEDIELDNTFINNIDNILNKSKYIAKTLYESGKTDYRYEVDGSVLDEAINSNLIAYNNDTINIILSINSDNNISEITLDLDDYGKNRNITTNNYDVTITYKDFGKIEEIINPVD